MTEKIALIGNPNSGKTTLFNALTGASQRVGNWSGVTVERREGICMVQNTRLHIVDLPGIYTLAGDVATMATDQWVTHSQLTEESWQVIVQVVDATQLARHLYLTIQLRERGFAVILALNMMDVYSPLHPHLDLDKLAHALGCPVIPISASRREGLAALRTAMVVPPCPKIWACVPYPPTIGDRQSLLQLENTPGPDVLIAQARYAWIDALCQRIQMPVLATPKTDRLDHFLLHPVLGIPAFLLILFLMFFLTIQGGSALQPFFENLPRQWIFDPLVHSLHGLGSIGEWGALLMAGIGLGVSTVATFIPVIGILFLTLSFLEDSGYMARAAFVMDQGMRRIGLPGQALVPLILGLGCNVPAVMAIRTLTSARDRCLTAMMLPFMSCGARLGIYAIFAAAFFPTHGAAIILCLYLIGILAALCTALLLRKGVIAEASSPLLQTLPPYRWPHLRTLTHQSAHRLWTFVRQATVVIVPLCIVLYACNTIGMDGQIWEGTHPNSVLAALGQALTPIFTPMGIFPDNWPATVGLITGILAKEVVIGTLNALYVPAEALIVEGHSMSFFHAMTQHFDGGAGAFAYLLFVLLYMPCISTVSAIRKELGGRWAYWSVIWTTGLAYGVAVLFYQCATYLRHPWSSSAWILAIILVVIGALQLFFRRMHAVRPLSTPIVLKK